MDDTFFGSHWSRPSLRNRYGPTVDAIPVRSVQPHFNYKKPEPKTTTTTTTGTPKVVQIPVHFAGSESSRSTSALIIQKVFRGLLVRKSVKKIMTIKRQVDEIEARVSQSQEVELIQRDPRERLKVNELLMALLFKLDSVRGVDSGVRDCRRAVIKKAIALQEKVDSIASSGNDRVEIEIVAEHKDNEQRLEEAGDQCLEIHDLAAENSGDQNQNSGDVDLESRSGLSSKERYDGEVEALDNESLIEAKVSEDMMNSEASVANICDQEVIGGASGMGAEEGDSVEKKEVENCEKEEVGVDSEMKAVEENCDAKVVVENVESDDCPEANKGERCEETMALSECVEESMETMDHMEKGIEGEEGNGVLEMGGEAKDDNKNRELLERMMKDNKKMMKLMTQLLERNEVQTRMLNTLTHRVEQLEKAFVCGDRIKRKKKKHSA